MKLYDLRCPKCEKIIEELIEEDEQINCPVCNTVMKIMPNKVTIMTNVIPSYPGCKKQKAGYVHSHGDKDATKIQSGYGGCVGPKQD